MIHWFRIRCAFGKFLVNVWKDKVVVKGEHRGRLFEIGITCELVDVEIIELKFSKNRNRWKERLLKWVLVLVPTVFFCCFPFLIVVVSWSNLSLGSLLDARQGSNYPASLCASIHISFMIPRWKVGLKFVSNLEKGENDLEALIVGRRFR